MADALGTVSMKVSEPDRIGRSRSWLVIGPTVSAMDGDGGGRFDADELEYIARELDDAAWARVVGGWPDPVERELLPWAVVHQAMPGPHAVIAHDDALCTLADVPEGERACRDVFADTADWFAFAPPGPGLARIARRSTTGCLIVRNVGILAWGDTTLAIEGRLASMSVQAAAWLGARGVMPAPGSAAAPTAPDLEHRLVETRGRVSRPHRMVLSIDTTMRAIADRPDAGVVARAASTVELTFGWPRGAPVELVPGVGQIAVGRDATGARRAGAAASHAHRIAASILDGFGRFDGLPEPDRSEPSDTQGHADGRPARGRVYIVSGAASGIGRDVARSLAGQGAQLGLGDLDGVALERVADELEPLAGRPVTVAGDLTDGRVVDELVRATVLAFGGIDGAVLNAGVALPGAIQDLSVADWRRSLDVNATSHFLLAQRLLPLLEAQGLGGSLVFIGSKNMFSPGAGFGAYSASKAALAQLARVVAIEAGPFGVRSNIVNPDNVFEGSALWSPELRAQRAAVYGIEPDQLEAFYTQRNLMKVPITGVDVARAVAFLLSDEANRTTACVLTVDGGVPGVFPR